MSAAVVSPRGIPDARSHGSPATCAASPRRRAGDRLGELRGARRRRRGQPGQAAQGPVPPRLVRHPRGGLRGRPARLRDLAAPSGSPRTGRSPSSGWATSAGRSRHTAASPPAASGSSPSSTTTPRVVGTSVGGRRVRPMTDLARPRRRAGAGHRRHRHPGRLRPGGLRRAHRGRGPLDPQLRPAARSPSLTASSSARSTCRPSCRSSHSTSSASPPLAAAKVATS